MSRLFQLGLLGCACFIVAVTSPSLWAQGANELDDIKAKIASIQSSLSGVADSASKLAENIAATNAKLDALQAASSQNTSDLRKLEEKVDSEIDARVSELDDKLEQLRRIVDDISAEAPGGYIPNLGQIQMNQPFGEITIRNQMESLQIVSVNGEEHWVQPLGGTVKVNVRPGVVSTSLPGYEEPKSWHVGPANGYKVRVDIVPRR